MTADLQWLKDIGFDSLEGWITPDGVWWAVDDQPGSFTHADVAKWVLGEDGEARAELQGWMRLSDFSGLVCLGEPTQKQLDTLFDWCEHHNLDYRETLGQLNAYV